MNKALLPLLLALPLALPTTLVIDAPPPTPLVAGGSTTLVGSVQLTGPTGPLPGVAGEVDLTLQGPPSAGCALGQASTTLDPTTGEAPFELSCEPTRPGHHPLNVTAESPPHRSGTWNATLAVAPDTLTGNARLGPVEGYRAPLTLDLEPAHLPQAPVNVTITSRLTETPLAFDDHLTGTAGGAPLVLDWLARHGPGAYDLSIEARGPATRPWSTSLTVEVPEPALEQSRVVEVEVEPGEPSVRLASDPINDDGKHKSPGENLTTRLELSFAARANLTVARPGPDGSVPLARSVEEADDQGQVEHVFAHRPLPAGTLVVQARVGERVVQRSANITDLLPDASVTAPAAVLADGRAVVARLNLTDPNFGSTPLDPGPVFGLPDVTWKVFRGSRVSDGWNVSVGPFAGPSVATAPLSHLAWPQGAPWATVGPGWATMDVVMHPPAEVEPGTYRLSLYDLEGRRLGGASFELKAAPALTLAAPVPHPGEPLPVTVEVRDPVEGLEVLLEAHLDGAELHNATLDGPGNVTLEVPWGVAAGTPVTLEATAHWPGRPAPGAPDALIHHEVPALAPTLDVAPLVDGHPVAAPVPLHPAGAHELALATTAVDPNGDPVEVSHHVTGPEGEPGWALLPGPLAGYRVPAQSEPGRYVLTVVATAPDGEARRELALSVATMARVGVTAPETVSVPAGDEVTVDVTAVNAGTTPLAGLLVDVEAPPSLEATLTGPDGNELPLGTVVPTTLAPGEDRVLQLALAADPAAGGTETVAVTVAGVVP